MPRTCKWLDIPQQSCTGLSRYWSETRDRPLFNLGIKLLQQLFKPPRFEMHGDVTLSAQRKKDVATALSVGTILSNKQSNNSFL
jgi:hypothetical protein